MMPPLDLDAIKKRHLDPERNRGRTYYEGHIEVDLAALVAEIERLRAEVDLLRTGREAARCYADRVEAEVVALRGERAAVVAWLGAEVDAAMEMHLPVRAATFLECAEAIERGAHRREEAK